MNDSSTITVYEEPLGGAPPALVPAAAGPASLANVEDIEGQIRRAERMGEALDKLRTLAAKRTVPGDWVRHGESLYLEGDGALRIAPMLGLRLSNLRKSVEREDDGTIRVTLTADAGSALFGTTYPGISRTRTDKDPFLTQNGRKEHADLEDVESSAYKGLVARAVQLVAGLSGLTVEEARNRFGLDLSGAGAVTYKGGTGEAKREDAQNAAPAIAEINKLLLECFDGNEGAAADWLERTTENKDKGWPGKRSAAKLTDAGAKFVLAKLKALSLQKSREPGVEG